MRIADQGLKLASDAVARPCEVQAGDRRQVME
jgi:hypothetical protein